MLKYLWNFIIIFMFEDSICIKVKGNKYFSLVKIVLDLIFFLNVEVYKMFEYCNLIFWL